MDIWWRKFYKIAQKIAAAAKIEAMSQRVIMEMTFEDGYDEGMNRLSTSQNTFGCGFRLIFNLNRLYRQHNNMRTPNTRHWQADLAFPDILKEDKNSETIVEIRKMKMEEELAKTLKAIEEELDKRIAIFKSLVNLSFTNNNRLVYNRNQCCHLIETYSKGKAVFKPLNIDSNKMVMKEEMARQLVWYYRNLTVQLTKIMQHGEILIRDCTGKQWLKRALTTFSDMSKNDMKWELVTPFTLNVQQFKLFDTDLFDLIAELDVVSHHMISTVKRPDPDLFVSPPFQIPASKEEREAHDRDSLLQVLCKLRSNVHEMNTTQQLANFISCKLEGRSIHSFRQLLDDQDFQLGRGSYGIVKKCKWLGVDVALKVLVTTQESSKEAQFASFQHPHVVRGLAEFLNQRGELVMELMDGDLRTLLDNRLRSQVGSESSSTPFSILQALDLMLQIAEGMRYIGESGVMHRDLKSHNILVNSCKCGDKDCFILKLGDFGSAKYKCFPEEFFTTKNTGTTKWRAPEVFKDEDTKKYTRKADVYSFAILCSEILTGKIPFEDIATSYQHLGLSIRQGVRPNLPVKCPPILSAYIHKCWSTEPEDRPGDFSDITEALRFIKGVLLRGSKLSFTNQTDGEMLMKHFGLKWCVDAILEPRQIYFPDEVYVSALKKTRDKSAIWTGMPIHERKQYQLKAANFLGNWTGVQRDYETAIWILRSAKEESAEAAWRLGYCYELGLGLENDIAEAVRWYKHALELDSDYLNPHVELGRYFATRKRLVLAAKYWEKAVRLQSSNRTPNCVVKQVSIFLRRERSPVITFLALSEPPRNIKAGQRLEELTSLEEGRQLLAGPCLTNMWKFIAALFRRDVSWSEKAILRTLVAALLLQLLPRLGNLVGAVVVVACMVFYLGLPFP